MDASLSTPIAPPKVILRADYQPPEWLVPEVKLAFNLGLAETRIVAMLKVQRNGASQTLRLNGDGLTAQTVLVDGVPSNSWRMDGADRKSTRLNSSHLRLSRMPSSA